MTAYTSTEITLIVGTIVSGLISVIGAIGSLIAAIRSGRTEKKVDVVEVNTNSRLTALDRTLAERDAQLAAALANLAKQETTRDSLAMATAINPGYPAAESLPPIPIPIPVVL